MDLLNRTMRPTPSMRTLDVGTGTAEGGAFSAFYSFPGSVIGVDILPGLLQQARSKLKAVVAADAGNLPFRDGSFDLVMSNAVIEHLPTASHQEAFAREVRRVGRRYFITTPNKWFPIELHYRFPLFQFLPRAVQKWLNRHFDLGFVKKNEWLEIRLLSGADLQRFFPTGKVVGQRVTFMPETLIAYKAD